MSQSLARELIGYIAADRAAAELGGSRLAHEGMALIADISGFTPLTEGLARTLSPARGAEELTRALNSVFAPLIDAVRAYGGSVVKFGGDALIVFFPRESRMQRTTVVRRAITAGFAMQAAIERFGRVQTPAGEFTLTMKVGMAYGPVLRVRPGDPDHGYEDVIGGSTLDRMAEAEHHAESGDVMIDPQGLAELAEIAVALEDRDGYLRLAPPVRPSRQAPQQAPPVHADSVDRLRPFVPVEVFEALRAGRDHPAELKPVVSMFVQFQGVHYEAGATAAAQLNDYFSLAQQIAARYGGRVNRLITGDKGSVLHLIFGAPRAVEEVERRTALCALELLRSGGRLPFIEAQRIGFAGGRVFAGPVGATSRREYTVMGDAINLSARLMQKAQADQIVIDATLEQRLRSAFSLVDLGPTMLKGKANPISLYALEGVNAGAVEVTSETPTAVVGRKAELQLLQQPLDVVAEGRGGLAVLVGDLGMGKTHLLNALRSAAPARWIGTSAAAYGQELPGALLASVLRDLLELAPDDTLAVEQLPDALSQRLGAHGVAAAPYLARLLGLPLDPEQARQLDAVGGESLRWRVFELARELIGAALTQAPLILAFDDLQWADPTSIDMIESFLPLAETFPLLMILATRPGAEGRAAALLTRVQNQDPTAWVELGPLEDAAATELLSGLAPDLTPAQIASLAGRGGGNPLFLVELARTAAAGADPDELPDTVQGLLLAQIDRLPGELRETLQRAAVLGRVFAERVLAMLVAERLEQTSGGLLPKTLADLQRAGFLVREGESFGFRHALIQESAYAALLYERRRGYHNAAAQAYEQIYPTQIVERSGTIAHHWEHAGERMLAARYHGQAADSARLLYANEEAEHGYRKVLSLYDDPTAASDQIARTNLKLAQVRLNVGDYGGAQELYDQAFGVLEHSGQRQQLTQQRNDSQVFRLGGYVPEVFDPGLATLDSELVRVRELFEGLVAFDADLNIIPAAARRWWVEDEGRLYRFALRPALQWSDGSPLTADDFVFAIRRNLHPDTGAGMAGQLLPIAGAAAYHHGESHDPHQIAVAALDAQTLEIRLEEPTPQFLYILATPIAFPQPAHHVERLAEAWSAPGTLVGNGPFILAQARRGEGMVLQRNPYYRHRLGNLAEIQLSFGPPEQDLARREHLDLVNCVDRIEPVREHQGEVLTLQYLNTFFLSFACNQPPFERLDLRRMLAQAIDRRRLVEQVWAGVQQSAGGGLIPPGMPGHSPGIGLDFDPQATSTVLHNAGVELPRLTLAALAGMGSTPQFLQAGWREHLGLEVDLVLDLPPEELLEGFSVGRFHMALIGWDLEFPEPADMLQPLFHSGSPLNIGWSDTRYDRLIEDAAQTSDPRARLEPYRAADRLLVEEAVAVPLYHSRTYALLRPGFRLASGGRVVRGGRLRLEDVVYAP
jgi:ABC-type oligopeptide transport system substrate-binding subunit/class 3 adenylate cyclase